MQNPLIEVTFEENTFQLKELESKTYKDLSLSITDLFSSKGLPESFELVDEDDKNINNWEHFTGFRKKGQKHIRIKQELFLETPMSKI